MIARRPRATTPGDGPVRGFRATIPREEAECEEAEREEAESDANPVNPVTGQQT